MNNDELAVAARDAAEGSYSPYSHFRVGANTAGSRGVRKILSISVSCIDSENVEGAYPCSRCRQEMAEFGVEKVIVTAGDGSVVREHNLEELLPHQFNL